MEIKSSIHIMCFIAGLLPALFFSLFPPTLLYGFSPSKVIALHEETPIVSDTPPKDTMLSCITDLTMVPHGKGVKDIKPIFPAFDPLVSPSFQKTSITEPHEPTQEFIRNMALDSGPILTMATGTIALLYVLPEDISQWTGNQKDLSPGQLRDRYSSNVKNGPVWDKDDWAINYIGHPYFGAAYYLHAMNENYTRLESLSYSFVMSTFMYEYGVEALFESPSIQDIIVTPVAGALVGELFVNWSQAIRQNDTSLLGSKVIGSTCLFLMDPIGTTLAPLNTFNEKYTKLRMEAGYFARQTVREKRGGTGYFYDHRVGIEISISTDLFFQ